jgi:hypothetical protein
VSIAVWIVSGILALVSLGAGGAKLALPRAGLEVQMEWVKPRPLWQVKTIGALEVLGAVGVIVPAATGIAPVLTPIAATGLAIIQVLAIALHVTRRDDPKRLGVNVGLLVFAVFVAVVRFAGV